jgi:hypothetical protein
MGLHDRYFQTCACVNQRTQSSQLRDKLELMVENGPQEVNMADWNGRLALELLGQAGLGYSFGILEGRNNEFCRVLKEWVSV